MSDATAELALKFITEGLQQLIDARLKNIIGRLVSLEQNFADLEDADVRIDRIVAKLEGSEQLTNLMEEIAREVVNRADFEVDIGGVSISVTA